VALVRRLQDRDHAEGVETLSDLEPGMLPEGVATKIAAFGAFVGTGIHQDGILLSNSFVKDPRAMVKPANVVKMKVLDVDIPRKRISLSLRLSDEPKPPSGGGRGGVLADALRRAYAQIRR
jgi:protein Tex